MSSICEILYKKNKELKECESLESMDKYFKDFENDSQEYFNIFNFISLTLSINENIDFDKLIISLEYYLKKYNELKYYPNHDFYIQIINNILTTINKKIVDNDFYQDQNNFHYLNLFFNNIKNILQIKIDINEQLKIKKDINMIFECFQNKSNLNNINKNIYNNMIKNYNNAINNLNNTNSLNVSDINNSISSLDESFKKETKNYIKIVKKKEKKEFLIKNIENILEKNNNNINYNIEFISNKNNNYNNNKLNESNIFNKNSIEISSYQNNNYENIDNIENDIIHENINRINYEINYNQKEIYKSNNNNFQKKSQFLKKSTNKINNILKTISSSFYYKKSMTTINIKDLEQNFKDNKYCLKCVGSYNLNSIKLEKSCIDLIFLPSDNNYIFISKTDLKNWIEEKNKNNIDILEEEKENDEDKKNFLFYCLKNKERNEKKKNVTIYIQRDKYLLSNKIIQEIFNEELNILHAFYYKFFLYFGLFNGYEVSLMIITFLDLKYEIYNHNKKKENIFHTPNYHNNKLSSKKIFYYEYNENNLIKFKAKKNINSIIDNFNEFMITFINNHEAKKKKNNFLYEKKNLFNIQFFFEQINENIKNNNKKNKIFETIQKFLNDKEKIYIDYEKLYENLICENNNQ